MNRLMPLAGQVSRSLAGQVSRSLAELPGNLMINSSLFHMGEKGQCNPLSLPGSIASLGFLNRVQDGKQDGLALYFAWCSSFS